MESASYRRNGRRNEVIDQDLLEATRTIQRRARIRSGIDPRGTDRLRHWVAVAVWESDDGGWETELLHDEACTDLDMKDYLIEVIGQTSSLT